MSNKLTALSKLQFIEQQTIYIFRYASENLRCIYGNCVIQYVKLCIAR
jgi:hypothetical protein